MISYEDMSTGDIVQAENGDLYLRLEQALWDFGRTPDDHIIERPYDNYLLVGKITDKNLLDKKYRQWKKIKPIK